MSRVSTRERMASAGSQSSINMGSLANSLHRVGSVTSVLRRLFSRDGPSATTAGTQTPVMVDGTAGPGSAGRIISICIILHYNMYYFHFTLQEPC